MMVGEGRESCAAGGHHRASCSLIRRGWGCPRVVERQRKTDAMYKRGETGCAVTGNAMERWWDAAMTAGWNQQGRGGVRVGTRLGLVCELGAKRRSNEARGINHEIATKPEENSIGTSRPTAAISVRKTACNAVQGVLEHEEAEEATCK